MAEKTGDSKIQCSICLNDFVKPKIIDCFHTFCEKCLIEYVEKRSSFDLDRFQCPMCRKSIRIPRGGVKNFSTNFYIEEKSGAQAQKKVLCKVHNLDVEYFCKECCMTVCFKCFVSDHSGHEGEFIEDLGERQKQELEGMRNDLNERISKATKYSNWLFVEKSKLQFLSDQECRKVDRQVKKICDEVQGQGRSLKEEIKKNYQNQCKELCAFYEDMHCMIISLKDLEKQVDDICQRESLVEVLSLSALAQVKSMMCNYYGYKDHPFGLPSGLTLQFKEKKVNRCIISKLIGKVEAGFSFSNNNDSLLNDKLSAMDESCRKLKTHLESMLIQDETAAEETKTTLTDSKSVGDISAIPKKFVSTNFKLSKIPNHGAPDTVANFKFCASPKQTTSPSSIKQSLKEHCILRSKYSHTNYKIAAIPKRNLTGENLNRNSNTCDESENEKCKSQSAESAKPKTHLQVAPSSFDSYESRFPKSVESSSDENTVETSSDENTVKRSSDENTVERSSDQNTVERSSDQIPDQNNKEISSHQNTVKIPSCENEVSESLASTGDSKEEDSCESMNNDLGRISETTHSSEDKTSPKNHQSRRISAMERKSQYQENPLSSNVDAPTVDIIYGETLPKLKTLEMDDIVQTERGKIDLPEGENIVNFTFDLHDAECGSAKRVKKLNELDLFVEMGVDNKSSCYMDIGLNNLGLYKMSFSVNVEVENIKLNTNQFAETIVYGYWGPFYRWHQVLDKETMLQCSGETVHVEINLFEVKRVK